MPRIQDWGQPRGRPGILLDRDGTIIVDYHYVGHIERVQLIPGAADAIARFNRAGIPVAVVTNQGGVARGFYPEDNVVKVHGYIAEELARHGAHIDLFLYSPYYPNASLKEYLDADHIWTKPNPGMALQVAKELDLDLHESWVVGDRPEDVLMAYHIGANSVYLGGDLDTWSQGNIMPYPFPSLASAAGFIIERITGVSQSEFPTEHYNGQIRFFGDYMTKVIDTAGSIKHASISRAAELLIRAYDAQAKVFIAGNGGAASIASHFKCDHVHRVGAENYWQPQVIDLTSDTALVTAIANDIGYNSIFSYQLERSAVNNDVLVVFSVSGNSANIIRALQYANESRITTIAVVASDGGQAAGLADVTVHIPTSNYGVAEDVMQTIMHSWAQFIRQQRMDDQEIKSARF